MISYAARAILVTAQRHAHERESADSVYAEGNDDRDMPAEKVRRTAVVLFSSVSSFFIHVTPVFFRGPTNTS